MNRRRMVTFFAILLMAVSTAYCGDIFVSGPVSGTWETGTDIIIEGPAVVLAGSSLAIEPGVAIVVRTTEPFIIEGSFLALGSEAQPIVIRPEVAWGGFSFLAAGPDIRRMQYVVIDPSLAVPTRVVSASNSMLDICLCDFTGERSCLDLSGGRAWVKTNKLLSTGMFTTTVKLDRLFNDIVDACSNPDGNKFCDNIVTAHVATDDGRRPPYSFTTALYVDGSTNLCLRNNTFTVRAPHTSIGAFFGESESFGSSLSVMERCNVTVHAREGSPMGVFNANTGSLRVLHCNIDAAKEDPESPFRTAGVLASWSADVAINSSSIVIDQGLNFFVRMQGAFLTFDYNTRWSNSGFAGQFGNPFLPFEAEDDAVETDDEGSGLIDGGHNIDADPLWSRTGEWGRWESEADVRAYYMLLPGSPCIDAGDTLYGLDPDETAPDIGRYPYEGTLAGNRAEPIELPTDIAVGAAYPNPFNLSTAIPFALAREAVVHVDIMDVLGRSVWSSTLGRLVAGRHELRWDAAGLGSGTYFVRLATSGSSANPIRVYLVK